MTRSVFNEKFQRPVLFLRTNKYVRYLTHSAQTDDVRTAFMYFDLTDFVISSTYTESSTKILNLFPAVGLTERPDHKASIVSVLFVL